MKSIKSFTLSPETVDYLNYRSNLSGRSRSAILDQIIQEYSLRAEKEFIREIREGIDAICPEREVETNGQE